MTDEEAMVLGQQLMGCGGFRWALPWVSVPDKAGRVFRRNCSPGDTGSGWAQVCGPQIRTPRWRDQTVPDLRCSGSLGALLALNREAWGDGLYVRQYEDGLWSVWFGDDADGPDGAQGCATEAEALVAALDAVLPKVEK